MTILSVVTLLFAVMDPFGNIPFFVAAVQSLPEQRRQKVIIRELLIALLVLILFLFLGQYLLNLLHISPSALQAAGGVVLFVIGLKMVFPDSKNHSNEENTSADPFIVPLAIPYLAGPSAMATLILVMNQEPERWFLWLISLLLAWFLCAVILSFSVFFARILGKRGLIAVERLMGMVLIAIAINMILEGIAEYIKVL